MAKQGKATEGNRPRNNVHHRVPRAEAEAQAAKVRGARDLDEILRWLTDLRVDEMHVDR
jgi:hypothetical protein